MRLYDADLDTRRYKVKDVVLFSKKQKTKKICNLAEWKKYCRAFIRIGGSLLSKDKITRKEYATYFWQGIPRMLKSQLENHLLKCNPVRDLSEPFGVEEVDTAASAILQRDQFDQMILILRKTIVVLNIHQVRVKAMIVQTQSQRMRERRGVVRGKDGGKKVVAV